MTFALARAMRSRRAERRHSVAVVVLAMMIGCLGGVIDAIAATPIPDLSARITDKTATLTSEQIALLDKDMAALEARKGAQIAVLMIATLTPADVPGSADDIESYAVHVFEHWKLGRKGVDDGVLLVIVKNDHKVRIEVGYGLEGAIPDATAARIIREYVAPRFRDGDYFGGIHDATGALAKLIDGEPLPAPLEGNHAVDASPPEVQWWAGILGIVFASLMSGFLLAATLKCLFNIFPIRIISIRVRRTVGVLAGPALIALLVWWVGRMDGGEGRTIGAIASSSDAAFGSLHYAIAAAITGWLGWSIAADGASREWAGGITWSELFSDIFSAIVGAVVGGITGGLVGSGGSRGSSGFSGGGGSSGGGGASGSW